MDAKLEKEITVTQLKAAALHHRSKVLVALVETISEFMQLTALQQEQIRQLCATVKAYEEKSVEPVGGTVPSTAPAAS